MQSFEFVQNPIMPTTSYPAPPNGMPYADQQQKYSNYQNNIQQQQPKYTPDPPKLKIGDGYGFTVKDEEFDDSSNKKSTPLEINTDSTAVSKTKRETNPSNTTAAGPIVVDDPATINTYYSSGLMLNDTLDQINIVASDIKSELDQVRSSRTIKGKYNYIIGLSNNLCELLEAKTNAIKEINNVITKSNDLDYKREKDRKEADGSINDDKRLMDLYSSFIKNPNAATVLGPSGLDTTLMNPGIITASATPMQDPNGVADAGYLNYLSNVSPEQNAMYYESNPNVKTVVIFDASNGNKFFQVMDMSTGQVVPNVTVLDNRFMDDTTIDLKNKMAKNSNLHETYPVVVINENIAKEY